MRTRQSVWKLVTMYSFSGSVQEERGAKKSPQYSGDMIGLVF